MVGTKEGSMSNRETRAFKVAELRVANNNGQRTLTGYAAVFNSPSEDFGGWSERIDPAAFNRTLSDDADVRCLVEHDPARIVGRTKSKTLRVSTDNKGLRFECDLPDTSVARDLITSIERGDLDACSFGFITQKESWEEDRQTNTAVRTLLDVDLLDTSVVCYPAYPATSASVRSFPASMPAEIRSRFEARRKTHTKSVDGENLTDDAFLIVGDPNKTSTWDLPWKFSTEEKTITHLRDALARFNQVKGATEKQLKAAWDKLVKLCKEHGITVADTKMPAVRSMDPDADGTDNDMCECNCAQCKADFCGGCSADPQCNNAERCQRSIRMIDHERAKMRVKLLSLQ
jgi:uncharacterized protein